jgi:hypothetical protein
MALEIKQGDTFSVAGPVSVLDGSGQPIDVSSWTVTCQVRFSETGARQTLTVTRLDATHMRLFHNATAAWPVGQAEIDLQFTSPDGIKISSKTEKFKVLEDVTIV